MRRALAHLPARHPASFRALIAALAFLLPAPAFANDSEAEWAVGGLVLKQNDAISMDREELFISAVEVKVDYTYTNHSDEDQTVLVSFPLPALPTDDQWVEYGSFPDWSALNFNTTVDGKPVEWLVVERAVMPDGRDVTAEIAAAGHPLAWFQDYEWIDRISRVSPEESRALLASGLFVPATEDWVSPHMPGWQQQYHVTREQVFPAKATVRVSHGYTPNIGGSVGGTLDYYGDPEWAEQTGYYRERYCTDDSFIAGFRKRQREEQAKASEEWYTGYGETWIGYILSSGANWKGPIKDFRLVVDKGRPRNLVSFCMDGVKKISDTQFEVRKQDFEPAGDLNILIVGWFSDDE